MWRKIWGRPSVQGRTFELHDTWWWGRFCIWICTRREGWIDRNLGQTMEMSIHALFETIKRMTITLTGILNGEEVLILVDTGSSNGYASSELVIGMDIRYQLVDQPFSIIMENGTCVTSSAICPSISWMINQNNFRFRVGHNTWDGLDISTSSYLTSNILEFPYIMKGMWFICKGRQKIVIWTWSRKKIWENSLSIRDRFVGHWTQKILKKKKKNPYLKK